MLADDEEDSEGLGVVGTMSRKMTDEFQFWHIVCMLHFPPREVELWTLGEMRLASAFIEMQSDYKRIWSPYYDIKKELS